MWKTGKRDEKHEMAEKKKILNMITRIRNATCMSCNNMFSSTLKIVNPPIDGTYVGVWRRNKMEQPYYTHYHYRVS